MLKALIALIFAKEDRPKVIEKLRYLYNKWWLNKDLK